MLLRAGHVALNTRASVRLAFVEPHLLCRQFRPAFVRRPCRQLRALFDDEEIEAEEFAPYWAQQDTDWEDPPEEQDDLADIWYEVR